MIVARAICAALWFIGATAMVLAAVYVWALICVTAIQQAGWVWGIAVVLFTFIAMHTWESVLLLPWRQWHRLWQWFDAQLGAKD